MPTLGWIAEKAEERYWESRPRVWEDHPRSSGFTCRQCGIVVASSEELRRHFNVSHPLAMPALYVHGKPLLRESVIRAPIGEDDANLLCCSRCEVQMDGGPWQDLTLEEFRAHFCQARDSIWNVRLVHERLATNSQSDEQYQIRFRIPNGADLNAVDAHFISTLAVEELSHSDLERFDAGLPMDAAAREYGHALGNYALGIVLKERRDHPWSSTEFAEFSSKMRSALETLRHFQRPVALAVSNAIRFNLNDFVDYGVATATELDAALAFFRHRAGAGGSTDSIRANVLDPNIVDRNICPIDSITHRLLSECVQLSGGDKISLDRLADLRHLIQETVPISTQDLAKIHVLCAEGFARLGRVNHTIEHQRAIQFDPVFANWAQRRLTEI